MVDQIQFRSAPIASSSVSSRPAAAVSGVGFTAELRSALQRTEGVTFSAHALERLETHGIEFTAEDLKQIASAIDQAAAKGGRESVILLDRVALVVSIPNRTVITVVPTDGREQHVFTNIDSVVVVSGVPEPSTSTEANRLAPEWGGLRAVERQMRRTE